MVLLGNKIKKLRINAKMSQAELARRLGLTRGMISFYERDLRSPSYDVLVKMAQLFKVSNDYILGLEPKKEIDTSGLTNDEIDIINKMIKALKSNNYNETPD